MWWYEEREVGAGGSVCGQGSRGTVEKLGWVAVMAILSASAVWPLGRAGGERGRAFHVQRSLFWGPALAEAKGW